MRKIRRDDDVIVIAGRDKGKRGKVVKITSEARYLVSGINMVKKHTKPNPMAGQAGGIVEKEAPIAASNVALFNPATGKGDRVGFKILEDGTKVRYFKSNGEVVGG
ncbi:MAG: large subunit ribosomal protein L24 [Motiliproteus sp.]|jgi:large subunit ribosomal protein L24